MTLYRLGITLIQSDDKLLWARNQTEGVVTSKLAYRYLTEGGGGPINNWWAQGLWEWHIPTRLKCFFWLVLHNRILTWDNLCRSVGKDLDYAHFVLRKPKQLTTSFFIAISPETCGSTFVHIFISLEIGNRLRSRTI